MKKQQFTEVQIIGILKEVEAGQKIGEICRKYGVIFPPFSGAEVTPLRQVTVQIHQGCGSPALRPVGTRAAGDYRTLPYK